MEIISVATRKSKFNTVCVFCGSSTGKRNCYQDAAVELGNELVGLLNVDGYYNSLLAFVDNAVDAGFIRHYQRNIIVDADNAKELVQNLEEYTPVHHDALVTELRWEVEHVDHNSLQAEVSS